MTSRRGFALAAAIACIVLIAVLATAALFASAQEARATRAEILDYQAFAYAERAAILSIAAWSCPACDSLAVGGVIIVTPPPEPPLESTIYTTRLDSTLFLVIAEGRVVNGTATRVARRISVAVKTSRDSSGVPRASPLGPHAWAAVYRM